MSIPENISLQRLVFDYLYHAGYVRAVNAFLKDTKLFETSTIPTPDEGKFCSNESLEKNVSESEYSEHLLVSMARRNEILNHVLNGRISEARSLLNLHFPSVLNEPDHASTSPTEHSSSNSRPSENSDIDSPSSSFHLDTILPAFETHTTATNPVHLSLDLRIHAFVESFRTEPLPYPPHPPIPINADVVITEAGLPTSSTAAIPSPIKPANGSESNPGCLSSLPPESASDPEIAKQEKLLMEAHRLWREASSLEDESDRKTYQAEMTNVATLLAYNKPEESPVAKHLDQSRRQAVADQIKGAILHREGLPPQSRIEHMARQTQLVFRRLNEMKVKLPQDSSGPKDLLTSRPPSGKEGKEGKEDEIIPTFELREFLSSLDDNIRNDKRTS